ncbi:MAG TPA: hypothetical protein VNP92_02135 [Actinophytocola sp.]|nr:hypothetical protein [Actinophytocola sp.]
MPSSTFLARIGVLLGAVCVAGALSGIVSATPSVADDGPPLPPPTTTTPPPPNPDGNPWHG